MNRHKVLLAVGAVAIAAAVAVAGTALAQTPTPQPKGNNGDYLNYFLDQLASRLGKSRQELNQAFADARNDVVDKAVQDGKLSQQQADRLKALPAPGSGGSLLPGFGPRGFFSGPRNPGPRASTPGVPSGTGLVRSTAVRDAVATALNISPQDLVSQLRSGKTLKELSKDNEAGVKQAILDAAKKQLDQAIQNNRITQQQADQAYQDLSNADVIGLFDQLYRPAPSNRGRGGNGRFLGPGNPADRTPAVRGGVAL